MVEHLKQLKGGSLSQTSIVNSDGELRVRKSISAENNREYGLVRWHSQLKRLQRYNILVPDLFPKVLEVGVEDANYFFDIEYFEGSTDLKNYLLNYGPTQAQMISISSNLISASSKLHSVLRLDTYPGSLALYFQEEYLHKIRDAGVNKLFKEYSEKPSIFLNGIEYPNLESQLSWLKGKCNFLKIDKECLTHGNLTLENILIDKENLNLRFIDPYDENIIDCEEADYSQIFQCSESFYGPLNDGAVTLDDSGIWTCQNDWEDLALFGNIFRKELFRSKPKLNQELTDFLHLTQFIRMLPFKVQANHVHKAILFYALSCKIAQSLREKYD